MANIVYYHRPAGLLNEQWQFQDTATGAISIIPNEAAPYAAMSVAELAAQPYAVIENLRFVLTRYYQQFSSAEQIAAGDARWVSNPDYTSTPWAATIPQSPLGNLIRAVDQANPAAAAAGYERFRAWAATQGGSMLDGLKPLVMMAGIAAGSLAIGNALSAYTGATAATTTATTTAAGSGTVVSSAAEIAAATGMPLDAAAVYSAAGFSAADLGTAAALDAAAAAGSVVSTVRDVQTVSKAFSGSGSSGSLWNSGSFFDTGAGMFTDVTTTIQSAADALLGVYTTVQNTKLQRAQIDAMNAQTAAANRPVYSASAASSGYNWPMIIGGGLLMIGAIVLAIKAGK